MFAEQPHVTGPANRDGRGWHLLVRGVRRRVCGIVGAFVEENIDFCRFPTKDFDRAFIQFDDGSDFDGKCLLVPRNKLGQPVVCQPLCADLRGTPVACNEDRDVSHADASSRFDTTFARDYHVMLIDQD